LGPPYWPLRPPARRLGMLAEGDRNAGREAAWLHARLIAADLVPLGISIDCAPVLDLALPGRTKAIGDRALAADPGLVALLGQAMIEGFLAGGTDWLWPKLEEFYRHIFEGAPFPDFTAHYLPHPDDKNGKAAPEAVMATIEAEEKA
ncbi:MAG: glycoside hydrolase family 3 N-terminal domain-containing protein, partial [Methyloceanibacter sp.]